MARFTKTIDVWALDAEARAKLQPGQHITAGGAKGRWVGQTKGSDVAAWNDNARRNMSKLTLEMVEAHAQTLGLIIEEDHVYTDWTSTEIDQPGYWMLDPKTGLGPWPDNNFSTSLHEVAGKLVAIEYERTHGDA